MRRLLTLTTLSPVSLVGPALLSIAVVACSGAEDAVGEPSESPAADAVSAGEASEPPGTPATSPAPTPSSDGDGDPGEAPPSAAAVQGTLRVMTFNIKVGLESDLASIAKVIAKENPDIVGLQEVDELTNRSGKVRQTEELAKLTKLTHRYFGANFAFDGGQYGLAILSKTPLTNPHVIRLDARTKRENGFEPRIAVAADTVAHGKPITFVSVHASLHAEERPGNAKAILDSLGPTRNPSIIVGDMNEKPGDALGKAFAAGGFVDSHGQKYSNPLSGLTQPAKFPLKRLDVVYKDAAFGATKYAWVPNTTASDHRPSMATFDVAK